MTTAHRPTFDPARGKEAQRGPAYHQRLLPAHTHLKQRQAGQGGSGGLAASPTAPPSRDLRVDLLQAEAAVKAKKRGGELTNGEEKTGEKRKRGSGSPDASSQTDEPAANEDEECKRRRQILEEAHDADADSSSSDSDSEEESEDEDEDEEAELLRELAKIKAERAAQRAAEEQAKAAQEAEQREFDIARGNPLLNPGGGSSGQDFSIKRRWDDDVVFKNQARGTQERGKKAEFVNDLLRSDFHKKFMMRYVK